MRLTTRGRYAVTAMLDVAMHQHDGAVLLNDIAKRQALSQSYLEQLFAALRRADLLNSFRGPGGGYQLARSAEAITVADIMLAIEESVDATRCQGAKNCHQGQSCLTHSLWERLNNVLQDFLSQVTLAELVKEHQSNEHKIKWHLKNAEVEDER